MKVSCVSASYIGDLVGYPGTIDWSLASERMRQAPMLETITDMLERLEPAGLDGIELYFPHVWPSNITPALASAIRRRLGAQDMECCACAGAVTDPATDPYGAEELFQTAMLLRAPLIAGHAHLDDVGPVTRLSRRYGIRVAYENGAERDGGDILDAIQGGNDWIGANMDTGNMAAQGGDPVAAINALAHRILHVHLKDVAAVGEHDCVALGTGIIDLEGVLNALQSVGYNGWLSIEIETSDHDPTEEIIASATVVRQLLRAA